MREVEQQISQLKNERFNDLTRPVSAFITFEEEDVYNVALTNFEAQFTLTGKLLPSSQKFMEEDLYFEAATEPTNIIWENRHLTAHDRLKRTIQVVAFIFGLIVVSFSIIFFCKSVPLWLSAKWKPINCSVVQDTYKDELDKYAY
jgi:hypothetical protein